MSSALRGFFLHTLSGARSTEADRNRHEHRSSRRHHGRLSGHIAQERPNALISDAPPAGRAPELLPEALPSIFDKKYDEPVIGTAVIDEETVLLDDVTTLFEMVTPASTPLLRTHVKERFEAAAERETQQRRVEQTKVVQDSLYCTTGVGCLDHSTNTFAFFPNRDSSSEVMGANTRHHRRRILNKGPYFIFSDRYLSAHPSSCITGVTNELHMGAPEIRRASPEESSETDAEMRRLREVKDYIKEVEHGYRPLFRRRRSCALYGRAQYLRQSDTEVPQEKNTASTVPPPSSTGQRTPEPQMGH